MRNKQMTGMEIEAAKLAYNGNKNNENADEQVEGTDAVKNVVAKKGTIAKTKKHAVGAAVAAIKGGVNTKTKLKGQVKKKAKGDNEKAGVNTKTRLKQEVTGDSEGDDDETGGANTRTSLKPLR